jgi:hypothetical protein
VHRVSQETGIKPHRLERYMASNDPDLETKAADVIGWYLNPPQHTAVFCVDATSAKLVRGFLANHANLSCTSHPPTHRGSIKSKSGSPVSNAK